MFWPSVQKQTPCYNNYCASNLHSSLGLCTSMRGAAENRYRTMSGGMPARAEDVQVHHYPTLYLLYGWFYKLGHAKSSWYGTAVSPTSTCLVPGCTTNCKILRKISNNRSKYKYAQRRPLLYVRVEERTRILVLVYLGISSGVETRTARNIIQKYRYSSTTSTHLVGPEILVVQRTYKILQYSALSRTCLLVADPKNSCSADDAVVGHDDCCDSNCYIYSSFANNSVPTLTVVSV